VYRFTYFNDEVRAIFSDKNSFWDEDLDQELSPILKVLKENGEIEGANCGIKPGISGLVYELKGRNFQISYTVNTQEKEIKFYEFNQISHSIDWQIILDQNCRNEEEQPIYIPQIGDPHKFIKAIQLIGSGVNTAKDLGIAFGSSSKNAQNFARRGNYIVRPLIEWGLACQCGIENKSLKIYDLTAKRKLIEQSNDLETRERLLAEVLLNFYPITIIIEETTYGQKELTKELIEEIICLVSLNSCGGETKPRRASSLRALFNWVTRWAGIPIPRKGNDGIQLYIPYIYDSKSYAS